MIDDLGGRKFILAVMALVLASALCWFEHIHEGVYSVIVVAVIGAYITGNVTQKALAPVATPIV
ncbi:MAG: hypothetical protein WCP55_09215 [Lentisphaerota bacterium]